MPVIVFDSIFETGDNCLVQEKSKSDGKPEGNGILWDSS